MESKNRVALFQGKRIRRYWDEQKEKWFFSVVDIVTVLTESENPAVYWRVFKKSLFD